MTTAVSIGLTNYTKTPVSTAHILSSSVMGIVLVDGDGLQKKTMTNILMTWVLIPPAVIILSGVLYRLPLRLI